MKLFYTMERLNESKNIYEIIVHKNLKNFLPSFNLEPIK